MLQMQKESLEKIRGKVIEILENTKINPIDKMELMLNIYNFLDPREYRSNIQILQNKPKFDKKQQICYYVYVLEKKYNQIFFESGIFLFF